MAAASPTASRRPARCHRGRPQGWLRGSPTGRVPLQLEGLEERLVLTSPFYSIEQNPIPIGNVGTVVNVIVDINNVPLAASGETATGVVT